MKLEMSSYLHKVPNTGITNLSNLKLIVFIMFCATLLFIITSSRYLTESESLGQIPSEIPKSSEQLNEELSQQINSKLHKLASFDKFNSFPLLNKHMKDDIYGSMTLETLLIHFRTLRITMKKSIHNRTILFVRKVNVSK